MKEVIGVGVVALASVVAGVALSAQQHLRGLGPVPAGRPAMSRVSCTTCRSGHEMARGRT